MDASNEADPGTALPRFPVPQVFSHLCDQAEVRGMTIGVELNNILRRLPGQSKDTYRQLQAIVLRRDNGIIVFRENVYASSLDDTATRLLSRLGTRP